MSSSGSWPSTTDYLNGLSKAAQKNSNLNSAYASLNSTLNSSYMPVPAVFLTSKGQSVTMPLSLYIQKTSTGYHIIDVTNPTDKHDYFGSTMDAVWNDFIQNNSYPDGGQIAAISPAIGGQTMSWKLWNQANTNHSFRQNLDKWLQGISIVTMVIGFVFPPAFVVSGLTGAASGIIDIADQVSRGDWQWDAPHIMEGAGVALNVGIFSEGLGQVIKMGIALKGGSETLTIAGRAAQTFEMGGKIITKGAMFTMTGVISADTANAIKAKIQDGLNAGESWDAIWNDVKSILGDSLPELTMTSLPFLPTKSLAKLAELFGKTPDYLTSLFSKMADGSADTAEVQDLADTIGVPTDLMTQIAVDQNLQTALQDEGAQQLSAQYQQYETEILPQVEAGQSDVTFDEYLFSTRTTVPDGEVPGISLYQQQKLDTLLNDPAGIPNLSGLTANEMADFEQRLRGDPSMQKASADSEGFNLQQLETVYKDWSAQGGANAAQMADRDFLTFLSDHYQLVVDAGDRVNCGQSAIALDATMGNEPVPTLSADGYLSPVQVAEALGQDPSAWVYVQDKETLVQLMTDAGPGSRAIVYGSRGADGIGHYFNIINDNGTIRIIDGQTHQVVNLDDFQDFSILQTAQGDGVTITSDTLSPHLAEVGGGASELPPSLQWMKDFPHTSGNGQYTVLLSETAGFDSSKFETTLHPTSGSVVIDMKQAYGMSYYKPGDPNSAEFYLEEWLGIPRNANPRVAFEIPAGEVVDIQGNVVCNLDQTVTVAPDFIGGGAISDSKFVKHLFITDQIRGFAALAHRISLPLDIYVRSDTIIDQSVIDLVQSTGGHIYRIMQP